jgi:cation transport regulator ChaC
MSIWIFGYGSLMWDRDWQRAHGCQHAEIADIQGYRRAFNKPSSINRGTLDKPGPTLNLVSDLDAICTGMALEFPDESHVRLFEDLDAREHNYTRHQRMVRLWRSGKTVPAHVYIYEQADVITAQSCDHIAQMAMMAHGKRGSGCEYIINTAMELESLGIKDHVVTDVYQALRRHLGR